jgi:hypothetical protein
VKAPTPLPPRPKAVVPPHAATALDGYVAVIDDLLDAKYAWIGHTQWKPMRESPYQNEKRLLERQYGPGGDWDGSDAQSALGVGSLFIELAGQHLEGIAALVRARQVIVPLAPLARSLFEACSRVAWILEPLPPRPSRVANIDIRKRAARITSIQLEDFTRAKTVSIALQHETAPKWGGAVRKLRRDQIPGRFWPSEIEDRGGTLILCGQQLPGFRDGAEHFERIHGVEWKATGLYDYLSNASHPTPTTIFEITASDALGSRRFAIEDATYPCRLCQMSTIALLHTWELVAEYIGQPAPAIQPLRDRIAALPV